MGSVTEEKPVATIQDVASFHAGVAPITVSRVLNHSGYASAQTRTRVEAAALELNYVPNSLARSLRSNRTHILALLADIGNPFWTSVARGVEDVANQQGFSVILCNTDEKAANGVYQRALAQAGRWFSTRPYHGCGRLVHMIQRQNTPLVIIDRNLPEVAVDTVRGDTYGGAYRLAGHLLALGHRELAILTGPRHVSTSVERVVGVVQALRNQGLTIEERRIIYGEF